MYPAFYLFADMSRPQALAFIPKAEKHIVVIIPLNEWIVYKIVFLPSYFVDKPAVSDGNLITASGTGSLLWTKQIIERLGVFRPDTLETWYAYFSTGEAQHFFTLMQTLPSANG